MNKNKFWTLRYAIINMTYFAVFCGLHAYASVFLLSKGFTNTEIGLTLALANVVSVLIQPVIAGWIDKQGKLTNRNVSMFSTICILVGSLLLLIIKEGKPIIFVIFAFIYMIQMAYQPLIIAMNFEYAKAGCKINFGLARGLGSIGFAIFSALIGQLVSKMGVNVLLIADILVMAFSFIMLLCFIKPTDMPIENVATADSSDNISTITASDNNSAAVAHNNFFDFAKTYPSFMAYLVGIICFFFAHNSINDYLIQIITPLGGNESQMGIAIFIAAALELPTMACINILMKKISCKSLLIISGVFFFIKIVIMFLATNITMVYISEICQLAAYALFIPASAYYVDIVMQELDQVKGQAYLNCAVTLGGVFSSVVCGRVLDLSGPKAMLAIGCVISFIGVIITIFSVRNKTSN